METLMQADIFFFISSIGFVIIFALIAIGLLRVLKLLKSLNDALDALKAKAKDLEADAEELIEEVRESAVFRLLFGRKRRKNSRTQNE